MKDFKQRGGGGHFGASRPNFKKKSWGGDDRGSRPEVTMHKATCATCGTVCEVPFRPVDGRPVFCKEHFAGKEESGGDRRSDRGPSRGGFVKRDFGSRPPQRPSFDAPRSNDGNAKQLEAISGKLDRVIESLSALTRAMSKDTAEKAAPAVKTESLSNVVKKVAKKAKAPSNTSGRGKKGKK